MTLSIGTASDLEDQEVVTVVQYYVDKQGADPEDGISFELGKGAIIPRRSEFYEQLGERLEQMGDAQKDLRSRYLAKLTGN